MQMKIRKRNKVTVLFFIVVMALENFSWLIDPDKYMVPGLLKFSDIGILCALLWMVLVYLECRRSQTNIRASWYPALFIPLLAISSLACYLYFGQPIGMSIRQNRYIIISFLMYYFIIMALASGKLQFSDLINSIKYMALFEICVFFFQYLLVGKVTFVYTGISNRYDSARLRVSYLLPLIFAYFALNEFMNGRKKVKNLIFTALGIGVLAVVCKHRAPTMIVLVTLICAYFLWKKDYSTKLIVFVFGLILLVTVVSSSVIVQDAIRVLTAGNNAGEDNFTIRLLGQQYYFNRLSTLNAWLVGFGEPNIYHREAYLASGVGYRFYLADNGVFGFLYCHGVVGILWLIAFFKNYFSKALYLFKQRRCYQYIIYIIFEIGNLYMGMHWYYYYSFPFILMFSALSWEYFIAKNEKSNAIRR